MLISSVSLLSSQKVGDRTEPPGHVPPGHVPPGHVPPGHLPPGHIPPGHLPPGHLPPGHLPPRTHTPPVTYPLGHMSPGHNYTTQTLKCPIWFMHNVLITYCTLKSIYFAEIEFICDEVREGGGVVFLMLDVNNLDKYPSCLSWQVLNKNRGRMADRTCSILFWSFYLL